MDTNTPNIPTDQQMSLIQSLVQSGVLSNDALQSHVAQNSDDNSQQSSSNGNSLDIGTLQSLIKHASNPEAVPMQQGDQIHPQDAIDQLAQKLTAGGPQIQQNAPASGLIPRLLGMKQPGLSIQAPADGLIPRLLGMKNNIPVPANNMYQAAKNAGITQYLETGLAKMPDGTPYVGPEQYQQALMSHRVLQGQGSEIYSMDDLTAQGVPPDAARKLMASAIADGRTGVSSKEISNYMGSERIQSSNILAQARSTMAGVAKLGQALKVGGFDAAQPMAEQAGKNLLLVEKAQPLIDQIMAQGGQANVRQQNELAANISALASNGSQVTDQRMNEFMPQTIMKKYGGWKEYFTNTQEPVDFTGFLPQMQDLLNREKQANQGVMQAASQLGLNIMSGTGQPNTANLISQARARTPIVSNTPPSNGSWKVIR